MSEASAWIMVQSWPWGSQMVVKKQTISILLIPIISYFGEAFVLENVFVNKGMTKPSRFFFYVAS